MANAPAEQVSGCLDAVTDRGDFTYDEAPTARDAIQLAARRRPSLILLNLHGSAATGLEACRELFSAEPTRDVPILAIAGEPAEQQFMISLSVLRCDSRRARSGNPSNHRSRALIDTPAAAASWASRGAAMMACEHVSAASAGSGRRVAAC